MKSLLKYLPVLALCAAVSCRTAHEGPAYLDKSLPAEERAADLLKRLTLEEKGTLMKNQSEAVPRLGIKAYNWWNEALHGVARNGSATVFPQPVGMAASFDEPLLYEVFTVVSDEARVKNRLAAMEGDPDIYQGLTFWTPNINLFRDPRWGRGMETYGEDPYLTGQLGMAVVRGLQGNPKNNIQKAHACAKHFAVHSGPEPLRHTFNATCSERDLHETYLPAFKDLVTKAGVEEVMAAYNAFRGKPCAVNDYLIDTLLRKEWGFKGIITTDCHGIEDLYTNHHWSKDTLAAISDAINNGIDLECGNHFQHLAEAVARGDEDQATIDKALFRLLTARFRLGEMDRESPWDNLPEEIVESPAHLELARKMARESLVLLQNRNDVLPLPEDARVALIGPNRDNVEMMWGNYNPVPHKTVTLLEGLQERFPDLRNPGDDTEKPDGEPRRRGLRNFRGWHFGPVRGRGNEGGGSRIRRGRPLQHRTSGHPAPGPPMAPRGWQKGDSGQLLGQCHGAGARNPKLRRHPSGVVSRSRAATPSSMCSWAITAPPANYPSLSIKTWTSCRLSRTTPWKATPTGSSGASRSSPSGSAWDIPLWTSPMSG